MSTEHNFKFPRLLYLDFEFNRVTHENVNLVSCVTHDSVSKRTKKFWLHNDREAQSELRAHLKQYDHIAGYACVAEARAFYSLNLDPLQWKWLDLFLEYRMLSNHNDRLNWGNQLVDGKVKFTKKPPPKWERSEEDSMNGFRPTHSLAEATYKLTGKIRDTEEKTACRDLIISDPKSFTKEERKRILDYNAEDVEFLPTIWKRIREEYMLLLDESEVNWPEYLDEALWRGRYSAHTAIMEAMGYPINYEATRNFSKQIPAILSSCQRDINDQFPHKRPFKWKPKEARFSWDTTVVKGWLGESGFGPHNWILTDKKALSLSLEAFERHFHFQHDYPRGNFGAQMVRFLKLKQALYGFSEPKPGSNKKTFWNSVGPDKRVRPYMNIYGAQSGRSQPAATGFMFLKPAWMRALVEPPPGNFLAGVDYGQQEFFIAALLSEDSRMVQAYLSGDPYLFMGKEAGAIPKDGTKKTHEAIRDLFKSTTLGILFMMTKVGLAAKLTADTGKYHSEDDAQDLIDVFEDLFPDFIEWRKENIEEYQRGMAIRILDGWTVWTDNDNPRSVGNVPVQGAGSAVMRKAVDIAVSRGVKVIYTLHDAIYIQGKTGQEDHIKILMESMREGFAYFFDGTRYEAAANKIKLDPKAWGPQFPDKGEIEVEGVKVPVSKLYLDSRAAADYARFSKYFTAPDTDFL